MERSLSLGIYEMFWHSAGANFGKTIFVFLRIDVFDCDNHELLRVDDGSAFHGFAKFEKRLRARYKYIVCFYVIVL